MSNNLTPSDVSYSWLKNITKQNFEHHSVVLIGTGNMAHQYGIALNQMNIKNVHYKCTFKKNIKEI